MRISDWSSDVFSSDLSGFHSWRDCTGKGRHRSFAGSAILASTRNPAHAVPGVRARRHAGVPGMAAADDDDVKMVEIRHDSDAFAKGADSTPKAVAAAKNCSARLARSEEHTSELQALMRSSYAV